MENLYSKQDSERIIDESRSVKSKNRDPFARDRARIIHSYYFRQLAGKTQLISSSINNNWKKENDFIRTRLTHSIEVAQVGREIAEALGANENLVDAACLAHDIGHPPFGHSGENVLNEVSKEFGGFDANCQTFRILTKLAPKSLHNNELHGLNLTRATIDSIIKYPLVKSSKKNENSNIYPEDIPMFEWVRKFTPKNYTAKKCIEAQIMDIADDIAYCVHDVEDLIITHKMHPKQMMKYKDKIIENAMDIVDVDNTISSKKELRNCVDKEIKGLVDHPLLTNEFDGSRKSIIVIKNITDMLIGYFCRTIIYATKKENNNLPIYRYSGKLVITNELKIRIAILKSFSSFLYYNNKNTKENKKALILKELYYACNENPKKYLAQEFFELYEKASSKQEQSRVILDQISGLTDLGAINFLQQ